MPSSVARVPRRYFIEFNTAMVLYIAAVLGRGYGAASVGDPALRTLLLVSPIVPVLLAALAVLRLYRGIDEYHRLQILESLALAAGVGGVITVCWSFLEDVGLPHLSIGYAWPIMGAVWLVASLYFGWRDKASEGAQWRTLGSVALTLFYMAAGTALFAIGGYLLGTPIAWPWLALVATVLFIARMGVYIFSKTGPC